MSSQKYIAGNTADDQAPITNHPQSNTSIISESLTDERKTNNDIESSISHHTLLGSSIQLAATKSINFAKEHMPSIKSLKWIIEGTPYSYFFHIEEFRSLELWTGTLGEFLGVTFFIFISQRLIYACKNLWGNTGPGYTYLNFLFHAGLFVLVSLQVKLMNCW